MEKKELLGMFDISDNVDWEEVVNDIRINYSHFRSFPHLEVGVYPYPVVIMSNYLLSYLRMVEHIGKIILYTRVVD